MNAIIKVPMPLAHFPGRTGEISIFEDDHKPGTIVISVQHNEEFRGSLDELVHLVNIADRVQKLQDALTS